MNKDTFGGDDVLDAANGRLEKLDIPNDEFVNSASWLNSIKDSLKANKVCQKVPRFGLSGHSEFYGNA